MNGNAKKETDRASAGAPHPGTSTPAGDFLDIRQLLRTWLKWSWLIVLVAAFGAYQGVERVRGSTPLYKASMVVQPDAGSSGLSSAAVELGQALGLGVAGSGTATAFGRLQVIVGSVNLAKELQKEHRLMQKVFAGLWNEEDGAWRRPTGDDFERQQRIRRFFGLSEWTAPSLEDLAAYLAGSIQFKPSKTPGFFEVSFRHTDPDFALKVLSIVYQAADDRTRQQDLAESQQRRSYVSKQLTSTRLVDSRQALINLLTAEEREAMLLESDLPYAARIIEPAFVSSNPEEPNIVVAIGLPTIMWAVGALLLITLIALFRSPS